MYTEMQPRLPPGVSLPISSITPERFREKGETDHRGELTGFTHPDKA